MSAVSRHWFSAVVAVVLTAMAALLVLPALQESQTWDEAVEIVGGYRYLKTGENRFFIEHPPLGRILAALPLTCLNPKLPEQEPDAGAFGHINYAARFLYRNRVPADTLLFAARLPAILVTLVLGLLLALWVRRAFGETAAAIALLLYSFDPNVLSQGHYTKSGLLLTLLAFASIIVWNSYLEGPRRTLLAGCGILFGLALATKFSALFLLPGFVVLQVWARFRRAAPRAGPEPSRHAPWQAVLVVAGIGVLVLLLFYAPETGALVPGSRVFTHDTGPSLRARMDQSTLPGRAIAWTGARLGLRPHTLLIGLGDFFAYNRHGQRAYLCGGISEKGWWYYFPLAFLLKTPLGALAALVWAAASIRLRPSPAAAAMAVPLVVYCALTMSGNVDTGLRHLLPAYPFLFALAGAGLSRAHPKWAVCALMLASAAETLSIYPHFTAFFNRAVGGPANGARYLVDSNLDWGQDLKKLKRYTSEHGIAKIALAYFGTADPGYYGLDYEPLDDPRAAAGRYPMAVSVTRLSGLYEPGDRFKWLRTQTPVARVGYSIYVYDLRRSQPPLPAP